LILFPENYTETVLGTYLFYIHYLNLSRFHAWRRIFYIIYKYVGIMLYLCSILLKISYNVHFDFVFNIFLYIYIQVLSKYLSFIHWYIWKSVKLLKGWFFLIQRILFPKNNWRSLMYETPSIIVLLINFDFINLI